MIEILKSGEIYGRIENSRFYIFKGGNFAPCADMSELADILPEGVDLDILRANFICDESELFGLLKNSIGDFEFVTNAVYKQRLKPLVLNANRKFDKLGSVFGGFESQKASDECVELRRGELADVARNNLELENSRSKNANLRDENANSRRKNALEFSNFCTELSQFGQDLRYPCELKISLNVPQNYLSPQPDLRLEEQIFSLSGHQHKLQAVINANELRLGYGDMILKPANPAYAFLAINEHLHTSFVRECGFEVPFNAVIWDEAQKDYAFIINRFDVGEHGKKLPQITLNALMKSPEKYAGSMKQIAEFLSLRLEASQKTAFVRYIFVNALLYNADLHKKNISFIEREVGGKKTLLLSPAYDIINVASLKGFKPFACAFAINGRQRKIRIKDFKGVFESLGLAWDESVLADIADIYKEKYPLYLESLKSFERFSGCEKYKRKCELLYKENLCYLGWN